MAGIFLFTVVVSVVDLLWQDRIEDSSSLSGHTFQSAALPQQLAAADTSACPEINGTPTSTVGDKEPVKHFPGLSDKIGPL